MKRHDSATPVLDIRNVSKTFVTGKHEVRALDNISLTVRFMVLVSRYGSRFSRTCFV